ncbi:FKBP-type peptidyl-prolyl cis-trans isomerase [Microbacterium aquimaris]|uniref:FKBP-type peptidyl-prolyl cis-trans isomerase n=1 Tax=Microbacterium aquimaris TaxID=459816 RepID=UPI002AD2AA0E|nr:FKBP-type peptidyl-prolyl cis-trans isomerase [Microbacterium aquimaris]MDZ8276096.1 FKBP-type peptidyl-prolyl cis-trans isomerase [Microbacterium aquimaris]
MRKISAALALVGLTSVGLVGCTVEAAPAPCVEGDSDALASLVTVEGGTVAEPRVDVYTPFHVDEVLVDHLTDGDGPELSTDSQLLVMDYAFYAGDSGELFATTAYDGDLSNVFSMENIVSALPGLSEALLCAQAGSRVVVGLPADGINPDYAAQAGLAEDESMLAVVDVRKVYLPQAEGELRYNSSLGMPTVVRAPDGRPGVIIPDATAPEDLVVQTLIEGDGDVVEPGDTVRVQYTGLTWAEREVFDTTWDASPAALSLDQVVPGFAAALEGQTVGSQVLAVIPPDQGYGDQASGSIPAGSTLVFVIDILGVDEAS